MEQLLCHLWGDYVFQNHWMAANKKQSSIAAFVHALAYTCCFICITRNVSALLIIGITHFFIDRYQLSGYWCKIWGIGCPGLFGGNYADIHIRSWLWIIVDNTIHLTINYLAINMFK